MARDISLTLMACWPLRPWGACCEILAGLIGPGGYLVGQVACLKMRLPEISALRNHRDAGQGQVIPSFCG